MLRWLNRVLWTGWIGLWSAQAAPVSVFVEAESFADKGGWVVDQQFVDQMGSPFLMAHGLGRPVADAVTPVEVPAAGAYRVWVRTRNWAPGDWEAPGRFRLAVNNQLLAGEFGTEEGWRWQDGGTVALPRGRATLALRDLTGFDGRCDAILLTTDAAFRPPDEEPALRAWRNAMLGLPAVPAESGRYDVVIVGGGIAGCAAALVAGEKGLKVALVHDRPILGGNASSEVRVHTIGITGWAGAVLDRINTRHWPNGSPESIPDDRKRHQTMENAKGVDLFLNWRAYDAVTDGPRITAVHARHIETGRARSFQAPVVIDCTGDGWIGYWAGADFRYGREAAGEFGEQWAKNGELWSPETPDNRIMGASLLWYGVPAEQPEPFPDVPWAREVAAGHAEVRGEWFWEYNNPELHNIEDAEEIRDHLLRAIYGSFANARKQAKYAGYKLDFVSYVLGKRESRRLMGDYLYTMQDMVEGRDFPDAVAVETRDIDVHYQRIYKDPGYGMDFLSTALFMKVPRYYIPFRTLYSRNIENLMMAGRCFSCSHIGLGGPRVMNTCGQMGVAVGNAAYLCIKHATTPRGVYARHLEELRTLVGAVPAEAVVDAPPGVRIMAAADPALRTATAYPIEELPDELKGCVRATLSRGEIKQPAPGFSVRVNQPVDAFMAVHERGVVDIPEGWEKTRLRYAWHPQGETDAVYHRRFPAGMVEVPGHDGRNKAGQFGVPHLLFLKPVRPDPAEPLLVTP